MSLPPRATARSRSWCTSWKSRVASAAEITNVGVDLDRQLRQRRCRPALDRSWPAPSPAPGGQGQLARRPGRTRPGPACRPRTWSGLTSSSSPTIRTPSASSTSATTNGSVLARAPAGGGARRSCRPRRSPGGHHVARAWPRRSAGHIGPGGWRSAPQPPQRWIRSSPGGGALPEERGVWLTTGREAPGRRRRPWPAARPAGRNFSTRNSIVATGSSPAYQVLRVVTNQPSPSAVRFGPGHVAQAGPHAQLLAVPQVAVVRLLAVGRDDRGVPGLVEHGDIRPQRIVGRPRRAGAARASSRPGSSRAVRPAPPCTDAAASSGVGVDRVRVADGLDPVADHRQVHRVAGRPAAGSRPAARDPLRGRADGRRGRWPGSARPCGPWPVCRSERPWRRSPRHPGQPEPGRRDQLALDLVDAAAERQHEVALGLHVQPVARARRSPGRPGRRAGRRPPPAAGPAAGPAPDENTLVADASATSTGVRSPRPASSAAR